MDRLPLFLRSKREILILALVALAAAASWFFSSPQTPAGQPALVSLSRAGFGAFEERFDDSSERVRVVALFSPT